ncbi:MAG: 4-hydroxy-3-methylbut-2-enyl diphosphate reductase [Defluviitaleaceae bacterium]|nr:4-hydroxy-3-methylbut-2-enyl diphosphate reductase [Defluviitaleaceae bacterium]
MIKTVKESGFCYGVQGAIHKANAQQGSNIYIYGDLVNNQHVMDRYRKKGFKVVETINEIPNNSTVIIRAHGIPRKDYEVLAKKNAKIIDCTCPKVKNIHKIVSDKPRVIIIGKHNHPETIGTHGWCKEGAAIIVTEASHLHDIESDTKPICVVGQTTCKKAWWDKAVAQITAKFPHAEIHDTLCDVTAKRITKATEMAKESDIMVVVGDKKSANSLELYEACKLECPTTLFVSSLEEMLNVKNFPETGLRIGLAGSASAPADIIEDIHGFLLFTNFLAQAKNEIETAADEYLQKVIVSVKGKAFLPEAIKDFYDQNQGGKRIRGAMIKLGAEIAGEKSDGFLPVAMAYELFQTAILIHDDIIDKSPMRRGRATIHTAESDPHFGNSRAICIGDYGLFLANKILAESNIPPETLIKIFRLFSQIQLTTLEGEIMDVSLPMHPIDIPDDYENFTNTVGHIFEYKTAWYTLVGPIMLGAIYSGADDNLLNLLHDITMPLGIAFQIKDDLLGIYGSEESLGKPALSDIHEKKQTLLYGYAYKHATEAQRVALDAIYGNPTATIQDLDTVREIFEATGAKLYADNEIERLSKISLHLINTMPEAHKTILQGLVHYLITRKF